MDDKTWIKVLAVALVLAIVSIIILLTQECACVCKLGFKSRDAAHGFKYETETFQFLSNDDRDLAINAVQKLYSKYGINYTTDQIKQNISLASINTSNIIPVNIRESDKLLILSLVNDDDNETRKYLGKLLIAIEFLQYTQAVSVYKRSSYGRFSSNEDKQIIYNFMTKYSLLQDSQILSSFDNTNDADLLLRFKSIMRSMDLQQAIVAPKYSYEKPAYAKQIYTSPTYTSTSYKRPTFTRPAYKRLGMK